MNKKIFFIFAIILTLAVILITLTIKKSASSKTREGKTVSISALVANAQSLEAKGDLIEAKTAYQRLINEFINSAEIAGWQKKIEEINIKLLFSSVAVPSKSAIYEINPGDTLVKIARQFKTTPELIMKSNNLANDRIAVGRKIKVWTAPFSIVVDKSQNILLLKSAEEVIKTYIVSTGANNSTPVGTFKIVNKLQNPTWFKAGAVVPAGSPENILGSRWLGLDVTRYGIHGTTEPQSLGKQATQGCVRMSNTDVEELYTIVPVETEVTIID